MTIQELKKNFGIRLKYLRLKRGLTQEQLAEKFMVASHYISDIERGRRNITIETIAKIASALGVEVISLFNFSE